jgi:hypothetical protein
VPAIAAPLGFAMAHQPELPAHLAVRPAR